MKLFAIFNLATAVYGLECLTCHGRNEADCIANGQTIKCQEKAEKFYRSAMKHATNLKIDHFCINTVDNHLKKRTFFVILKLMLSSIFYKKFDNY